MKMTEMYFLHQYTFKTAFRNSLAEESGLGAHGNIIMVARGSKGEWAHWAYIWSHIVTRPWGQDVSQQCVCGCLRTNSSKMNVQETVVTLTCSACKCKREFPRPDNLTRDGTMGTPGRGEWYFQRTVIEESECDTMSVET